MRSFIIFFFVVIGLDVSAQRGTPSSIDLEDLEWLAGTWKRTNAKPGRSGYEHWEKINDHELRGVGVSLKDNDTLFVEKLKIIQRNDTIYYVADVPGNNRLIYFRITTITDNGFVCENTTHDFPKRISYFRKDQFLKAQISGEGREIAYFFERQK